LLNFDIFCTCPHNTVNFGPLAAEICWQVWGTPANFNGFRVLASLLHRRRSTEVSQTLHDVWPSPGLIHYVYIWRLLPLIEFFPRAKFTLRPILALYYISSVTAHHSTRTVGVRKTLRHGTRNAVKELSQRVPPIFGRAAITLGIGAHSSYFFFSLAVRQKCCGLLKLMDCKQ